MRFAEYAGRDYSHRKECVLERLSLLTSIFAIEIGAYALMSKHYHLVLYVAHVRAEKLSDQKFVTPRQPNFIGRSIATRRLNSVQYWRH